MNIASGIASLVGAAGVIGAGMYKLGSGMIAMSQAIRSLTGLTADHEKRLRVLEQAPVPTASGR